MLETTIAGSLPKPAWLAEPRKLWPAWRQEGEALAEAKRDATILALKLQEDAGIDIVSDGEMSRQHFVHGFLENLDGIDFAEQGADGHPQQPLRGRLPERHRTAAPARQRPRDRGADRPRPHHAGAQIHPAGADDDHRHHRRPALRRPRRDGDGVRRSAQRGGARTRSDRRRRDPVRRAGLQRLHRRGRRIGASRRCTAPAPGSNARPPSISATATASRRISTGRPGSAASGGNTRRSSRRWRRAGSTRCRWNAPIRGCRSSCWACSRARTCWSARSTSRRARSRLRRRSPPPSTGRSNTCPAERLYPCTNCGMAPLDQALAYKKLEALSAGAALVRGRV